MRLTTGQKPYSFALGLNMDEGGLLVKEGTQIILLLLLRLDLPLLHLSTVCRFLPGRVSLFLYRLSSASSCWRNSSTALHTAAVDRD